MWQTQLWLLAFLAFSSLTPLADGSVLRVMSAPNVLRIGTTENIFVECQDCINDDDIRVKIRVMTHPTKNRELKATDVTLTKKNKFQGLGQITIPAKDFNKDPNIKQYVFLEAVFPEGVLEKVVLVSFQSGYIFIQTDKPLYTPSSTINYRIFGVTPGMKPVDRDSATDHFIITEIVTPDGIILRKGEFSLRSGIHTGEHKLGEIVSTGLWKVVAKFNSNPQQSFYAEFEVKEYVLPSLEVKLTSQSAYFHVNDKELTITIKAMYLFGKEVDGMAYVVFGVEHVGQKNSFPDSLQRVPILEGEGEVTLRREHITQIFQDIHELVGRSIYVAVSVLTESGSEMVEAVLKGIQIVTSPYNIQFKKTPKYFKPGMIFTVSVKVQNPDGTPANGISVVVNPGEVGGRTSESGMAKLPINTQRTSQQLEITASTDVDGIDQASATMTIHPYTGKSNNYLHIDVAAADVNLGVNYRFNLVSNREGNVQKHITYLVLSRSQLVKYGRLSGEWLISASFPITKDMLPSFRIIAYYHVNNNEVVSDSVWVNVQDSCMGSLKLKPITDPPYRPLNRFELMVTGDPGATVGMVAVDKGVYVLNNEHRLTQKKIWEIVEKFDTGCTPGGGSDGISVFYDAGLLFESSVASGTPYRQEFKCEAQKRRKRATTILDVRTGLVSQYDNELQRDCCLDGMRDTPLSYTCQRRSEYITDGAACVDAFVKCCTELEGQRAEMKHDILLLARSEDGVEDYKDSNDIVIRSQFPESWLWTPIELPRCSRRNCEKKMSFPLKDSITTWQFTGISLSSTHGICVSDPLDIIVKKDFFIDLRLPYSAVRGEQLEIKAILHNYINERVTVRVDLIETEHVCSAASKRVRYRQEVSVGSETTRAVPFVIIPMKEGEHSIEVRAAVRGDRYLSDGIRKMLLVVPEGVLKKNLNIKTLNPAEDGVAGKQEVVMNSNISMTNMVPNSPTRTDILVSGREQISELVENAISGNSMGTLIKKPGGCGEQNMIRMTLPVIATMYLDKTNQWETVGIEKRKAAIEHIKTGYQNELAYRKRDGSFSVFKHHKSSTWLTAYVAKVFAIAYNLVAVEKSVICDAVRFLILNAQIPDGHFKEVGSIIHGEMIGDVQGAESDVSLTAFCLIAMQESRTICEKDVNLPESVSKSVAYLERHLPSLTNPYAVAMTSYALANENKLNRLVLAKFVSSELDHWPVQRGHLYTLEATAYALLALVKANAFADARPVVRWFTKQQKDGGGYGSTQATIMVYQAVAEYWASANEEEYDVDVNVDMPNRADSFRYNFNRENHYATKSSKFNNINQDVKVIAMGKGEVTVKMVSLYYALPEEKESDCQKFDLSVQLIPEKVLEEETIYKLKIEVMYKGDHDATMTIVDVGLLTGFIFDEKDLKSLSTGRARIISKYEMDTALSERGSLIIYLDKVSHERPQEITFRIHQKLKVGVMQPAAVTVYEYYNHGNINQSHCVKFYHPKRTGGYLMRLCTNDECTCAEENCSMQKKEKISNNVRKDKACESTRTTKIEYVYKVSMENFTEGLSTDIYTMRVMNVIKEAKSFDVIEPNALRIFLGYTHCRPAFDLKKGNTYLIMGTSRDIHVDNQRQEKIYVLGERTWIESWPTEAECLTEELKPTCDDMEDMLLGVKCHA
ncbi:LOW QUALITY PROTEIN: complement C3-like [Scomber scombrus]|uniref:LOW QUALITY PROTEIN: complement C3-like n=1 Tax=Scomber scombrus TaxID=13677 RepID=UPI002DD81A25|nr:LOW QUALITY PROTEIN: complement C3-like [Scomber scombrus]